MGDLGHAQTVWYLAKRGIHIGRCGPGRLGPLFPDPRRDYQLTEPSGSCGSDECVAPGDRVVMGGVRLGT
ncbi:MAG: hypothetical protein AB7N95_13015 [Nitrospiraceae bacterium]